MRINLYYDENDKDVLRGLDFFDRRRHVVRAMVPPGYEAYFQEQARYISAHTSTAIEGNPLGHETAMLILAEGVDVYSPAAVEKVNLDQAYQFIALLASDKSTKVDEGIIRTMNSIALKGLPDQQARNRGKYRIAQNLIVDSAVMMHGYASLMREFNNTITEKGVQKAITIWKLKVERLSSQVQYTFDQWRGDLFAKRNPLWQRVGVVKPGRDGKRLTVLNTGAVRSECGRVLKQLLAVDRGQKDLRFLAPH